MSMEFGKNLEQLMLATGWNQTTLGDALGSGRGRVNNWVAGRNEPDFKTLKQISGLMGVPVATLLGEPPSDSIDPTAFAQICREVSLVRVSVERIFCTLTEQARVLGFDISELSAKATAESSDLPEQPEQLPPADSQPSAKSQFRSETPIAPDYKNNNRTKKRRQNDAS